jgi:hypothetical protein
MKGISVEVKVTDTQCASDSGTKKRVKFAALKRRV